jgi:hypothetical protein
VGSSGALPSEPGVIQIWSCGVPCKSLKSASASASSASTTTIKSEPKSDSTAPPASPASASASASAASASASAAMSDESSSGSSHHKSSTQPSAASRSGAGRWAVPRLALGLVHSHGRVWDMKWLPAAIGWTPPNSSAAAQAAVARLGFLCVAFGDGSVMVVAVPHPSALAARGMNAGSRFAAQEAAGAVQCLIAVCVCVCMSVCSERQWTTFGRARLSSHSHARNSRRSDMYFGDWCARTTHSLCCHLCLRRLCLCLCACAELCRFVCSACGGGRRLNARYNAYLLGVCFVVVS